jgi:hypothetical protein
LLIFFFGGILLQKKRTVHKEFHWVGFLFTRDEEQEEEWLAHLHFFNSLSWVKVSLWPESPPVVDFRAWQRLKFYPSYTCLAKREGGQRRNGD